MKQSLVKTPRELAISAADEKEWIKDKQFILVKVPLKKLTLGCAQNISASTEIIIDTNKNKVSSQAAGFVPSIMVLAGADKVLELKRKNVQYHDCWVSLSAAKQLKLTASDQSGLGANQLNQELSSILREQMKKGGSNSCDSDGYSYIIEMYPSEKYFIYSKKGMLWKQSYTFIGKSQMVSFLGAPVRVKVTYSEMAAGGDVALVGDEEVIRNYGAKTSEANTGVTRTMSNVIEALGMYAEALSTGMWVVQVNRNLPIPSCMIHAAADAVRANTVIANDEFVVMDFLRWQEKMLGREVPVKFVDGKELQASAFAVVANDADPSTWAVPLNTPNRVKRAYEQIQKIKAKPQARERVFAAAEQFNLV